MPSSYEIDCFSNSINVLGLGCKKSNNGNYHVGIIYKNIIKNDELYFLHFTNKVNNSKLTKKSKYFWIAFVNLPVQVQRTLCIYFSNIKEDGPIPLYSVFEDYRFLFDSKGTFKSNGDGGVTCATYVLAQFYCGGLEIIDPATWPNAVKEDFEWAENLFPIIKKITGRVFKVKKIRKDPWKHFLPQEVFVTGKLFVEKPLTYEEVSSEAQRVLEIL